MKSSTVKGTSAVDKDPLLRTKAAIAKPAKLTVNFTSSVDKNLLKRAKVVAAKMDTSINALFSSHLLYLIETFEQSEQNSNDNYHILLEFSLGKISSVDVLYKLALDNEEDLFLLMAKAHLPMPRLPDEETREMVNKLKKLYSSHQKDH